MSSASDWYRRHLGGGAGQSPPPSGPAARPSPNTNGYYAPPPQGYQAPPGYVLVPAPQQQEAQGYYGPDSTAQYLASIGVGGPGGGGSHANPWVEPPPPPVDTALIPRGSVNPTNFLQLANLWRGGQGKQQAQHCPRCDGVLFRRFEGRREAAPLCTSCGWNGLFDQGEHAHTAA